MTAIPKPALSLAGIFIFIFLIGISCASTQIPSSLSRQTEKNIKSKNLVITDELTDYFLEIAFGSEYKGGDGLVTWNKPIRIKLLGDFTTADSMEIAGVVSELNNILSFTNLHLVNEQANISIYFTDKKGFEKNAPDYAHNNSGYFSIQWTPKEKHVTKGKILINIDQSQERRNHVIREEITQILGLMNDSERYPDSIFYQNYSTVTQYSSLDKKVLQLWEALRPLSGYKHKQIKRYLRKL
ncbi:DUF2927 domain-containing protein [Fodinibius sp.]|uniref:DUF2927 domain-containing protein n=1 Tax=Fodinibius sp. TaxID=1872440 RepID=UPI002ACD5A9E|nr:DUF2927 domain-containing protein [Fodinibius sp.]MDZ7659699.1 DUF2927 domain-containing protein [Fodinibius sp.]